MFDYLPIKIFKRRYWPLPDSPKEIMRRWPRLIAHIICESLGYATPTCAALIILDAKHNRENWCEWVYSCYNRQPKPVISDAWKNRHNHYGCMSEYKVAISIVRRAIEEDKEPLLGSWF